MTTTENPPQTELLDHTQPFELPMGPLGHVPPLDGLRGIAVSAVFLVHLYATLFGGGNWGVDLFFVLSGFLITKLLYEEYDRSGSIALKSFYTRRFFRLQPAMAVLLLAALVSSYTWFSEFGGLVRKEILYAGLLSGNLWALGEGFTGRPLLGHTWSLGLEEQFYLVWPFVLALIPTVAFAKPREFLRGVAIFTVASILIGRVIVAGVLDYPHWGSIPFFNIDGLAMGCMLAVFLHTGQGMAHRVRPWMLAVCALIPTIDLFLGGRYVEQDDFGVRTVLLRLIFTYLVFAAVTQPRYRPVALLDNVLLRFLGRISYSLYLWHLPVFEFFNDERFPDVGRIPLVSLRIIMSFVTACGSYYLVERPVLGWYKARRARRLAAAA